MCGISGAFVFGGRATEADRRYVRWSAGQMRRRGPDAEGYAEAGQALLGFRRLAIRDLSAAADQPMRDPSGRYLLAFNGELYHIDRLKALLPPDTVYRTRSDTEVLMHCLAQWGVERALPLLDGMFALAWYDSARNTLTLARDRCGIKPLYYALNERLLLFGSEYDLLLCHGDFRDASPNLDALAHYLRLGFAPDGEALYRRTWLLPHGHYLQVGPDGAFELRLLPSIRRGAAAARPQIWVRRLPSRCAASWRPTCRWASFSRAGSTPLWSAYLRMPPILS